MGLIEIAVLGIIGVFVVLGFLIGLAKGMVRAIVRVGIVVIVIVAAIALNPTISNSVLVAEAVDGQTLKEFLTTTITNAITEAGVNIDASKFVDLLWPMIVIIIQIVTAIGSIMGLLAVSWIVTFIADIIFGVFLKGKKKHRLAGGFIGMAGGLVVAVCVCSMISGLAPSVNRLMNLTLDNQKIYQMLNVSDEDYEKTGLASYDDSVVCKVTSLANPLVYDRVSTCTIDGKSYTLDSQIKVISNAANLASTVMGLADLDFSDESSIGAVCDALADLDFSNLSEEEKEVVNTMIDTAVDALGIELGEVELNADTLAGIDFQAVGTAVELVSDIQNGEEIDQAKLTETLGAFITTKEGSDTNVVDLVESFDVDLSNFAQGEAGDAIESAITDLEKDSQYSQEDIDSLKALFGLN